MLNREPTFIWADYTDWIIYVNSVNKKCKFVTFNESVTHIQSNIDKPLCECELMRLIN